MGLFQASRRPCQSTLHNSLATFLCSPIEHAFAPQPKYQFTLCPVQSSTLQPPIPIDPALLPLPPSADLDLRDGLTITNAIGLNVPRNMLRSEPIAKYGCPQRSANYSKEDVRKMFDLVAELLPVGQKGWKEVERWYNKWAKQNGRAERPPKALENKYKQYLRQKKPTGSGSCPPEVKCAHEIEDLINQFELPKYFDALPHQRGPFLSRIMTDPFFYTAHLRGITSGLIRLSGPYVLPAFTVPSFPAFSNTDITDSKFDDRSDNSSSDDDIEVVECTVIARRAPTPPLPPKSRVRGTDLANKLTNAFDTEVQKDCDEVCAHRSFEILTLSQQLCDKRATMETLRNDVEQVLERVELFTGVVLLAILAILLLAVLAVLVL
ncbi:hypothetical protein B0H14DRAFT_3503693 [Mycena olivaceomarginata]|nr:hypothetical protein B0H14DRAFT_3503693 [Mycena olivaceomarginata]